MKNEGKFKRICAYCNEVFFAKQRTTNYCGPVCGKRGYKKRKKEELLEENLQELHRDSQEFDMDLLNKKTYLTVKEACAYLEISRTTLYRLRKMGYVPQIGIGAKVLFKREDLEDAFGGLTTIENFE